VHTIMAYFKVKVKVKVKQFHYSSGQAKSVPGFKVHRFRDNGTGWW